MSYHYIGCNVVNQLDDHAFTVIFAFCLIALEATLYKCHPKCDQLKTFAEQGNDGFPLKNISVVLASR